MKVGKLCKSYYVTYDTAANSHKLTMFFYPLEKV